jgi:hypothetical protein
VRDDEGDAIEDELPSSTHLQLLDGDRVLPGLGELR